MSLKYLSGFGNDFESEALIGALPLGQNSPQRCNYGLYAEQLSGTAFTAPKGVNERSWLYRIRPSVRHTGRFNEVEVPFWRTAPHVVEHGLPLGQLRWEPMPLPLEEQPFISGVRTMTTAGDAMTHIGMAAHVYSWNSDRTDEYFCNSDGELLFVPQYGAIRLFTELGVIEVSPGEIAIIPRGMFFQISRASSEGAVRGYFCENYGSRFTLPERGPIGANCLANPRDFKSPVAAFEDKEET
jgi:homogentisate 1,2-dioxygenase